MRILAMVLGAALLQPVTQGGALARSLDAFDVLDQQKFDCARSIAIKQFPVEGEFQAAKDLKYYQDYFATRLAPGLRKLRGVERVEIVDGNATVSADLVIDGSFVDLIAGSHGLRTLIGFGAGKSICSVEMKGVDAATGTEVFVLEHYRRSSRARVADDEVAENLDAVILDVVEGLKSARGACAPASSKLAAK